MSFKNAFKILISRFGLAWVLVLFLLVVLVIVGSLSYPFVRFIYRSITDAGIDAAFSEIFRGLMDGDTFASVVERLRELWTRVTELFSANKGLTLTSTLWVFLILTAVYRFVVGFYELPMLALLEGAMSSDARLGFFGAFIAALGKSSRFILVKMIYTILFDAFIFGVIDLMLGMFKVPFLSVFTPFIIMLFVICALSFRYTLIAMWAPAVVTDGKGIFAGFIFSVKKAFQNFGSVYGNFAASWVIIIALNIFIAVFTFGAGLLASVPVSMLFVAVLNMTLYYNKNEKRYYVDGVIVTPKISE
ncbi:MAG: hypothetical protein LBP26_07920 [Clostridiales bacterium]|jgi:hypothetical protein|nr:hypothetical protein [Clostridiales bacterium]